MFRWVNLTDIHVGMSDQEWLWPDLKHELYDDLTRLIDKSGAVDAIIFSGDMVQKGIREEFDKFTDIIGSIITHLEKAGRRPQFIAVPGNHDLVRPKSGGMLEAALRGVLDDRHLLRTVLDAAGEYLPNIAALFAPFAQWQSQMIDAGLHARADLNGLFPGDASYALDVAGKSLGVITLNSSWLQLGPGDYQGRLHVDPRQLAAVTDMDPTAWCRDKWARLLVSHHPIDWLTSESQEIWNSDIYPPGRFDLHLFGHMHSHGAVAVANGGGGTRRSLQGASIFGLEYIEGKIARAHGYSIGEIAERAGGRELKVWPRTLQNITGGGRRLYPDLSQGLNEDNYFIWPLDPAPLQEGVIAVPSPVVRSVTSEATQIVASISQSDVEKLRHYLPSSRAHLAIRGIERADARRALECSSVLWIGYEWGSGEDGFLWSILSEMEKLDGPIFRIEMDQYRNRASFLHDFHFSSGFSFEQFCDYISRLSNSVLLLDGCQTAAPTAPGQKPVETDIEELCAIIREFAPATKIVLRGRLRSEHATLPFVALNLLEEADVGDYVRAHGLGGDRTSSTDITTMWKHTSGSPVRLDALLRDLKVTSLSDLTSNEIEYGRRAAEVDVPPALAATVRELQESEIEILSRSYSMLEALSSLPRGEQFERMRRFQGAHGYWTKHVHELTDRGLVESVQLAGMARAKGEAPSHTLIVPRIVRDFIRETMSEERRRDIDARALELYFGTDWGSGFIQNSLAGKRCANPLCEPYEITNASILIQRLMIGAHDEHDMLALERGIRLTSSFVEVLRDGHHYSSAADLCAQILPIVTIPELAQQADVLRYGYARSIRMTGDIDEALSLFEAIDPEHLSWSQKRTVSLNLALIYESKGNQAEAQKNARKVLESGKKDGPGLQAQSIIVQLGSDEAIIVLELKKLEAQARKIKAVTTANNIALDLANRESGAARSIHLERIINNTDLKNDFFNGARAIVQAMRNRTDVGEHPTEPQLLKLIDAYQHLYNERAGGLFDRSHDALWAIFVAAKDVANLLRLFRHSSLIWRLRNQEDRESQYSKILAHLDAQGLVAKLRGLDREVAYFRARTAAALDQLDSNAVRQIGSG